MFKRTLIIAALTVAFAVPVCASQNPTAKVALDFCGYGNSCEDICTFYNPDCGHIYPCAVVLYDVSECRSLDYSVNWYGSTFAWVEFESYSDITIGTIENPGDAVSHQWSECQTGAFSVVAWINFFEIDGIRALIRIEPHPHFGSIRIGDCQDPMAYDDALCSFPAGAGFGQPVADPCGFSAAKLEAWGGIKSLFR